MIKNKRVRSKKTPPPNVRLTAYSFNFMDSDKSEFTFKVQAKNKLEAKAILLEKIENELYKKVITKEWINHVTNKADLLIDFIETTIEYNKSDAIENKLEETDFIFQTNSNTIAPLWIDEFINEPWYKNN